MSRINLEHSRRIVKIILDTKNAYRIQRTHFWAQDLFWSLILMNILLECSGMSNLFHLYCNHFSNSRQLSHTWTEEFSQQQRPAQFSDQNGNSWANQYLAPTPNLELESAWSAATLQSSSQPVLASEYLERFDSGQMINDQQSSMANGWLEEFLSQHKVSDDTET